jgi:hypothetical protein
MQRRLRAPFSLVPSIALGASIVRADNRAGRGAHRDA